MSPTTMTNVYADEPFIVFTALKNNITIILLTSRVIFPPKILYYVRIYRPKHFRRQR